MQPPTETPQRLQPAAPAQTIDISVEELNARMLALCGQRNAALDECVLLRGQIARLEQQLAAQAVRLAAGGPVREAP